MTFAEIAFIALVVMLLALGVYKAAELGSAGLHWIGERRARSRRTAGPRLGLPGTRVVRFCEPWRRRQSIRTMGGGS